MNALKLALLRAVGGRFPDDAIDDAAPPILRAIATDESLPLEIRIDAGERAESFGALPAQDLVSLYERARFENEELANPSESGKTGPLARALMFQAAKAQSVPVARAGALQAYWRLARRDARMAGDFHGGAGLIGHAFESRARSRIGVVCRRCHTYATRFWPLERSAKLARLA